MRAKIHAEISWSGERRRRGGKARERRSTLAGVVCMCWNLQTRSSSNGVSSVLFFSTAETTAKDIQGEGKPHVHKQKSSRCKPPWCNEISVVLFSIVLKKEKFSETFHWENLCEASLLICRKGRTKKERKKTTKAGWIREVGKRRQILLLLTDTSIFPHPLWCFRPFHKPPREQRGSRVLRKEQKKKK